jgi:hypothetical protein
MSELVKGQPTTHHQEQPSLQSIYNSTQQGNDNCKKEQIRKQKAAMETMQARPYKA